MRATSGGGRPCTSVLPSPRPARKSAPTTSGIRSGGLARRGGALRGQYRDASPDRACRQALCRQWLLGGPAGTGRSPRRTDPGSGPTQYAMASRSRVRGAFAEWAVARPRRRGAGRSQFCHGQFWHAAAAASLAVALLDLGFDRGRPRVHSRRCDRRVVRRHHHGRMSSIFAGLRGRRAARDSPGSARAIWPKAVIYGH
jgi:hypothetical protein